MKARIPQFATGAALSLILGCGGGSGGVAPADPNPLPFVQCTIKSGGKDVEAATVAFHSKGGSSPKITSHYDPDSTTYRFTTQEGQQQKSGVPEGAYVLTVKPGKGTKVTIPSKYSDPKSSGLAVDVKKGENFLPPLELKP